MISITITVAVSLRLSSIFWERNCMSCLWSPRTWSSWCSSRARRGTCRSSLAPWSETQTRRWSSGTFHPPSSACASWWCWWGRRLCWWMPPGMPPTQSPPTARTHPGLLAVNYVGDRGLQRRWCYWDRSEAKWQMFWNRDLNEIAMQFHTKIEFTLCNILWCRISLSSQKREVYFWTDSPTSDPASGSGSSRMAWGRPRCSQHRRPRWWWCCGGRAPAPAVSSCTARMSRTWGRCWHSSAASGVTRLWNMGWNIWNII